ncbi:hypothetical protein [Algoriphagus vanfongensis]|uniref:hypothetical protein n=1 Tax=Algoriphagus vanfongensis TaxID=426371 RepID=UPI0004217B96|nr:hypothetical protein [Algoriphagus vanfongensis]
MRQISAFLLLSVLLFSACTEDADRTIQTNLPVEASQLLETSTVWGESLYFTLMRAVDYQILGDKAIPGCPSITVDGSSRQVILDFSNPVECELINPVARTGKITITYSLESGNDASWLVQFDDYQYGNTKVSGSKTYQQIDALHIQENFEALTFETESELTTKLTGEFYHEIDRVLFRLLSIQSTGTATGTNPAGREVTWDVTLPRLTNLSCLDSGNYYPQGGKEAWLVSREPNKTVSHSLEYLPKDSCQVDIYGVLPDGRKLLLNP